MPSEPLTSAAVSRQARLTLLGAGAVTLLLPHLPLGRQLAWPLLLLSTLAHEAGHGIAGLLAGGTFENLHMWANGSGVAHVGALRPGWPVGLMAAGGLVGPAAAAALLFLAARSERFARGVLLALAALCVFGLAIFVRGGFGMAFVALLAAVLAAVGVLAGPGAARFTLAFLGVQLALAVFSRGAYLFAREAHTGAGILPSDVAQMARALGGTYWLWGLVCGAFSIAVLVAGLWLYLVGPPRLRRRELA